MVEITVRVGDITTLDVSAIVNAANSRLAGGGGVDGAIHRAAGQQQLQAACAALGGCPTGEVRLTPGFNLAAAIIHAVGPVWQGGDRGEPQALRSCYAEALGVADEQGFVSIAFPAISCGVYGYPHHLAVEVAVAAVYDKLAETSSLEKVIFCCFDVALAELYRQVLAVRGER